MDLDDLEALGVALADATRLRVLATVDGELSVGEIATEVGVAQSTVSHHLNRLEHGGLVRCVRRGNRTVARRCAGPWDALFDDDDAS